MHICIVGTGASGWVTAHWLANLSFVNKITIIGSSAIPAIGVGESTTQPFQRMIRKLLTDDKDYNQFLVDIDAAIKYGVSYEGWSKHTFLHAFLGNQNVHGYMLGQKLSNEPANPYLMPLHEEIYKNTVSPDVRTQGYSFHFDANKFISAMQKLSYKNSKINHIDDTVIDSVYIEDKVSKIVLEKLGTIEADFFISCIGQAAFNMKVFKEEYHSYSNELLTDKALFYPLKYTDKRKQFHPYTVAKTMKNGWRWITPTWSRIGTGYVFSSNHISVDEATNELLTDIGDMSLTPHLVDFYPRKVKKTFKINSCTLGMAAGFLEPLDAPGLAILIWSIDKLVPLLSDINNKLPIEHTINKLNSRTSEHYDWWVSFILHQYKTCHRSDSQFWIDHKNVKFDHYDKIIENLKNVKKINNQLNFNSVHPEITMGEFFMFYNTTSGKDIQWPTIENFQLERKYPPSHVVLKNHLDFLEEIHNQCA